MMRRPRRGRLAAVAALAAVYVGVAGSAAAQAQSYGPAGAASAPPWLVQWSPLADHSDLRREPLGSGLMPPRLLELPAPKTGLFWTAGNPGAIPWEVVDRRAEFEAAVAGRSGAYRRPLEPGSRETLRLAAGGWRPLGGSGAGVGRVVVDRLELGDGSRSNVARPYGSNPLTVVDTAGDALEGLRTRLEGAGGWRLGRFGLGVSAGYAAHEIRTAAAAVPRLNRLAYSGATAGAVYRSAGGGLQLGVHGRVQRSNEFIQLFPLESGENLVYQIEGFREPTPRQVGGAGRFFFRYLATESTAAGVSAGGTAAAFRWVAAAEAARHEDVHQPELRTDAPLDTWHADLRSARVALQGPVRGFAATLQAGLAALEGEARLDEFDEVIHEADHTRFHLDADLRRAFGGGAWQTAIRWRTEREIRSRHDRIERIGSEIRSWTHAASAEAARRLGSSLQLAAGGGLGVHSPGGSVPFTADMGPVYQRFIAPGLYVDGTAATFRSAHLAARWGDDESTRIHVSAAWRGVSPNPGNVVPGLLPPGSRSEWTIAVGVVPRP